LADEVDNSKADEKEKPFNGVPITIKENIDFVGTPSTNAGTGQAIQNEISLRNASWRR
jgi:Asp-tRNA(Asn)/Glu-tRNA(Gln) amidotransferase A subunit family amidase